jgi:hypothetical protein
MLLFRTTGYEVHCSLGEEMQASSGQNFAATVNVLRRLFPNALFDERLFRYSNAVKYSGRAMDDMNINCSLIYLFHLYNTRLPA